MPPTTFLLPLQALALLLLALVTGLLAGRLVPHMLTAPAVAAVWFTVLNALDLADGALGRLSPIYSSTFYYYGIEPNGPLVLGVTGVLAGSAAALLMLAFGRHDVRTALVLTLALGLVGGGVVALATAPPGDVRTRAGGAGECERAEGVTLCAWPGPDVPLAASLQTLAHVRAAATPVMAVPTAFYEPGLDPPSAEARSFMVPKPGMPPQTNSALLAVVPRGCGGASEKASNDLTGLVAERLQPGSVDPAGPWAAGGRAAALPLPAQREWAAVRLARLAECR